MTIHYTQQDEHFFPAATIDQLKADLDAAQLRERAALEQARLARESAAAYAERLQAAEARAADFQTMHDKALDEMDASNLHYSRELEKAEARTAELERTLESAIEREQASARRGLLAEREAAEWQAEAERLAMELRRLALLNEDIPDEMADNKFVFDIPVWLIRQVRVALYSAPDVTTVVTAIEWQAHAARLASLMQEAIANCETCRGKRDGCARCASFREALSAAPIVTDTISTSRGVVYDYDLAEARAHIARLAAILQRLTETLADNAIKREQREEKIQILWEESLSALSATPAESLARLKALEAGMLALKAYPGINATRQQFQDWQDEILAPVLAAVEAARTGKAKR